MAAQATDPQPEWTPDQTGGYCFHAFSITPSDTDELPYVINRLYVGVAGDIKVTLVGDATPITLKAVPVGLISGLRIRHVIATGTTATNLIGFY